MMHRREPLKSSLLSCGAALASRALGSRFPRELLADTASVMPIVETTLGRLRGAFAKGVYSFKSHSLRRFDQFREMAAISRVYYVCGTRFSGVSRAFGFHSFQ
jgi:hypothetical protein